MNPVAANDPRNNHRDLVLGCQRGERASQHGLYQQYAKAMYNICLRMLSNNHDAEDVLQVVFVDVFRKIDTFNFEASIGAWIKRITVNRCLDHLKKKRIRFDDLESTHYKLVAEEEDEESGLAADPGYTVELIRNAMRKLSEGYRVVLSLYLFEGYDHEEISQILGISSSTSKSQYHRAKKRIRQIVLEEAA
ncbi:RNA polymerase [Lewinellaceae bacterium SD302]|nr:RNA polymerase [Lewinellaceae bacterium SD302]